MAKNPPAPKRKPTIAERFPPRRKPSRDTKKPYRYSKGALEKELERIMEKLARKPDPVEVTEKPIFVPQKKKPSYEQSFEKLRQKYIDEAIKRSSGKDAIYSDYDAVSFDQTRSLALLKELEPYLKDNPMAQLGFDIVGGGEGIAKILKARGWKRAGMAYPKNLIRDIEQPDRYKKTIRISKDQKPYDISGVMDLIKNKKPFVWYADDPVFYKPNIEGGLATLVHELGHIGDVHLNRSLGLDDDISSIDRGELFQQALNARRRGKFRGTRWEIPEPEELTNRSTSFRRRREKRGLEKYPDPYEHSSMQDAMHALNRRLREEESELPSIPRPKRKPKK